MKITLLHELASKLHREGKGLLRIGQCYMNALADIDKALYAEITGTPCDPFYVDDKIPQFLDEVTKAWRWDEN